MRAALERALAYRLPALEEAGPIRLERVEEEDFPELSLSQAGNNSPRGIWSDGGVIYVADEHDARVYSYDMPAAIDAHLASLTLSGIDEFSPARREYAAVAPAGVTEATVDAHVEQPGTGVGQRAPRLERPLQRAPGGDRGRRGGHGHRDLPRREPDRCLPRADRPRTTDILPEG